MNVAIIGAGHVATALGTALRRAGHGVIHGVRKPDTTRRDQASVENAVSPAELVILAIPFGAAGEVTDAAGGFAGKIVIDATNPLGMSATGLGLTLGFTTSGAEQLAARMPGAALFKTFNQTGFENLAGAQTYPSPPLMFVAGDDEDKKPRVMQLVTDAGFEAVDLGGLRAARLIEPFAMVWIEMARKRGHGPDFAFTMQRRTAP